MTLFGISRVKSGRLVYTNIILSILILYIENNDYNDLIASSLNRIRKLSSSLRSLVDVNRVLKCRAGCLQECLIVRRIQREYLLLA